MKKGAFIILLAAVVILGGAIGGALAGGMTIGTSQGREEATQELQSQLSQLTARSGQKGTQQGTPQPDSGLPGGLFGKGGTVGTVESVEGNVITLNTLEGAVRVLVAADIPIQKMGEGSLDDISSGDSITVSGEQEDDGSIDATNIFITASLITQ